MRALFTLLPGTGCLHPLLPLARALRDEGHGVAFVSSPSMRAEVEGHGMTFFGAGPCWHTSEPDYIEFLCELAGGLEFPPLVGPERLAWVTANLFIGAAARAMLPDTLAVAEEWRADLVVRQFLEFSGCTAAEVLGVPHASVADAAHSGPDLRSELAAPLGRLRDEAGLGPDPDGDMAYRHLHLCFMPPRFDGPDTAFPETARFLRHANGASPTETLPPWVDKLPHRRTVLVSMGTVFHRTPGLYESVLEALADEPVNVIVALGSDQDPARLGPQPPHVRVEPYVPLVALLPRCDLFITHGGFNSVKEALSVGVPMVVLPVSADQPQCAERCTALGVAIGIDSHERTPARIGDAARTVLRDPAYRREARRMQADIAALPDLTEAVALLTGVTRHRGVLREPVVQWAGHDGVERRILPGPPERPARR